MNIYLLALKNRLDNGEITQEVYDSIAEELKEEVIEPVEYVAPPTEIELLQEENNKLKTRLYETESITTETSATQEMLIELLLDMGVM